ncbi:hypothetical protein PBAL39_02895 [Pedobacter sp. BAL39]|uniref:hypothetical protein n=1 Tax=Pedobacter sp. BAL39 TaxID=391596 RepID=UPI0001559585|nr:hypothetical protein [Pedobacter sp. BAL39]EDM34809.1 hypothetical protein PBAL39_02895 [Pedobacter sp. BAL39]
MLRSSDQEYKITRQIKLGKLVMDERFMPLADWINKKYHVELLNVITDTINDGTTRVQLIFEHQKAVDVFLLKNQLSQSSRKEKTIIKKYNELYRDDTEGSIFILFYAFEPLAREEAVGNIPVKTKDAFKVRYNELLWEVAIFGEHVTFFFFSNQALKKAELEKQTIAIKEAYYALLKPYDTFDYFSFENFHAIFDSKENFDRNYDSNWRSYYG